MITEVLHSMIKQWIDENYKLSQMIDNDILIDGYKVCGRGYRELPNGFSLSAFQISFEVDAEAIREISTKEIKKEPRGLNDFGNHTREDLIKHIRTWLHFTG